MSSEKLPRFKYDLREKLGNVANLVINPSCFKVHQEPVSEPGCPTRKAPYQIVLQSRVGNAAKVASNYLILAVLQGSLKRQAVIQG